MHATACLAAKNNCLAAKIKCLAESNRTRTESKATNKRLPMSLNLAAKAIQQLG